MGGVTYALVTTFSPKGFDVYGRKMLESAVVYLPADVPIYAYYEGECPAHVTNRVTWVPLDRDQDRAAFMRTHKDREDSKGSYRYRVVTYSHKVFAMSASPRKTDHLIWLDADCVFLNPVSPDDLAVVCAEKGKIGSYLGRPYHRHSETGFLSFSLNAGGDLVLNELRNLYTSGEIVKLPEWHDSMAFDAVRRKFEQRGYRFTNICADSHGLNVFPQSQLAKFVKHNKGAIRKEAAYGDHMVPGLGGELSDHKLELIGDDDR